MNVIYEYNIIGIWIWIMNNHLPSGSRGLRGRPCLAPADRIPDDISDVVTWYNNKFNETLMGRYQFYCRGEYQHICHVSVVRSVCIGYLCLFAPKTHLLLILNMLVYNMCLFMTYPQASSLWRGIFFGLVITPQSHRVWRCSQRLVSWSHKSPYGTCLIGFLKAYIECVYGVCRGFRGCGRYIYYYIYVEYRCVHMVYMWWYIWSVTQVHKGVFSCMMGVHASPSPHIP